MKSLREFPGLLKRHYEKAIVALALLGLVASVFYLNKMKTEENEKIDTYNRSIGRRKVKPIQSVDVSALSTALARMTNPPSHNFAPPHNLLNPVKWQRRPDGTLIKVETGKEIGPDALAVTRIAPLNLMITLEQAAGNGFNMGVMQEGATNAAFRRKFVPYVSTNSATDRVHSTKVFTLREVNRTAQPPEAVIELSDGNRVTVSTNKPFTRVMGYKADLKYPPEPNRNFNDRRVGDVLTLAGD